MKTETKGTHTPGPWTVDEDLTRERRVISGAENEVVAEVIGSEDAWDPADTDRLDAERDANARLDAYTAGWLAAEAAHRAGLDVQTHASQGDTDWDRGWNAYIEYMVKL